MDHHGDYLNHLLLVGSWRSMVSIQYLHEGIMISLWIVILSFVAGTILISQDRWILGAPFILGAIFLWLGIITICGKGALQYCGIM